MKIRAYRHLLLGSASLLLTSAALGQSLDIDRVVREPFAFEGAHRSFPLEANPYGLPRIRSFGVSSIDFDADGDPDLAQVTEIGTLDLVENRGGSLVLRQRVSLASSGFGDRELRTGDFNGDGHPDIAVGQADLEVFLGEGRGEFRALPPIPLPALQSHLAKGDFDGDGRDDLAIGYFDAQHVDLIFGNGTRSTLPIGFETWTLAAGDLNGDQRPDLVGLRGKGGHDRWVHVRLNDGSGGFTAPGIEYGPWTDAQELALVDGDGDGNLDVVICDIDPRAATERTDLIFLPGNGTGSLGSPVISQISVRAWIAKDFEIDDLDGDGVPDLAVFLQITRNVQPSAIIACLKGDAAGGFSMIRSANADVEDFEILDLDGDGRHELVGGESQIIPLENDGGPAGIDLGFQFPPGSPIELVSLDANGDGLSDLLAVEQASGNRVELRLSDGEGGFETRLFFPGFLTSGSRPIVAELDGNGAPDIVLVGSDAVTTLLNDGQGNFASAQQATLQYCSICQAWLFTAGDFTGDGLTDILIGDRRRRDGLLLASLGNGQFVQGPISWPATPSVPATGDLTGDGIADVVWASREVTNELILWPGNGNGTFQPARVTTLPFALGSYGIDLGDTDHDGDLDVVVTRNFGYAHLRNDGQGNLSLADTFERPSLPFGEMQLIDIDGDGDLDLSTRTRYSRSALWTFENRRGVLRPTTPVWEVGADGLFEVFDSHFVDLDADGRPDLVLAQWEVDPSAPRGRLYFGRPNLRSLGTPVAGATIRLDLRMPEARRQPYQLLASLQGTYPGVVLPSGERFPLRNDPILYPLILGGGGGIFSDFQGTLDDLGLARASIDIPQVLPIAAPFSIDLAYLTNESASPFALRASNALRLIVR
ncbi:MAG: VCBS repeat-containing protein [Planctomycetota bacterium]